MAMGRPGGNYPQTFTVAPSQTQFYLVVTSELNTTIQIGIEITQ